MRTSGHRPKRQFRRKCQPTDSFRLLTGQQWFEEVSGEIAKLCPNIEAQVKVVKEALKELKEADPLGLSNIEEAKRDYPALFGVEPWPTKQPTTESKPVVKKHNGRVENLVESNPLQRADGKSAPITETDNTRKNIFEKGDKVM